MKLLEILKVKKHNHNHNLNLLTFQHTKRKRETTTPHTYLQAFIKATLLFYEHSTAPYFSYFRSFFYNFNCSDRYLIFYRVFHPHSNNICRLFLLCKMFHMKNSLSYTYGRIYNLIFVLFYFENYLNCL